MIANVNLMTRVLQMLKYSACCIQPTGMLESNHHYFHKMKAQYQIRIPEYRKHQGF